MQQTASHITHGYSNTARQFVLNVERVLLGVSALVVLINETDAAAHVLQQSKRVARGRPESAREGIGDDSCRRQIGIRRSQIVCTRRKSEGSVAGAAWKEQLERRKKDAVTGTDYGPGRHTVRKSESRLETKLLRIALMRRIAADSRIHQATFDSILDRCVGDLRSHRVRGVSIETDDQAVVSFHEVGFVLVSQTKVECQALVQAEVILNIARIVSGQESQRYRRGESAAGGISQQQTGDGVSLTFHSNVRIGLRKHLVERENTCAFALISKVHSDLAVCAANTKIVPADELRIVAKDVARAPLVFVVVAPCRSTQGAILVKRETGELLDLDSTDVGRIKSQLRKVEPVTCRNTVISK